MNKLLIGLSLREKLLITSWLTKAPKIADPATSVAFSSSDDDSFCPK